MAWIRFALALILLMHGVGHIMGFSAAWVPSLSTTGYMPRFTSASWIFSGGIGVDSPVGRAFALLLLVAMLGFLGSAVGLVTNQAWWIPMAAGAAVLSLVAIVPWMQSWPPGSFAGAVLVDLLVIAITLLPWGQRFVQALH